MLSRRHTLITLTTTLALAASTACAQNFTPPSLDLSTTPAGKYALDTSHASVLFNISHLGFSNYHGRFNTLNATMEFDPKSPEKSKVDVTIDASSIDTNNTELEAKLKSDKFFDTAQYPTIRFVSKEVTKISANSGKMVGELTMHGVTKPISLDVTFNGSGMNSFVNKHWLGFSAKGKIKRSDFGISEYIPAVGEDVSIAIEAEFMKAD